MRTRVSFIATRKAAVRARSVPVRSPIRAFTAAAVVPNRRTWRNAWTSTSPSSTNPAAATAQDGRYDITSLP